MDGNPAHGQVGMKTEGKNLQENTWKAFPMDLGRVFILMERKNMKAITNLDTKLVNGYTLIKEVIKV